MNEDKEKSIAFMREKSIEAFLLSLEIFNKPTIKYRLEGCVYLLCNAWELLLKAKLLKDGRNIFYPNKENRTLSLADCCKSVFGNEKDPVRQNLNVIISLRNSSTHFIIPEYEASYMPFLAFCVKSYSEKLYDFLGENINNYIKTDFLSLFVCKTESSGMEILSKYGTDILKTYQKKSKELQSYFDCDEGFSIAYRVNVNLVRISNKSKADYTYYVSNKKDDPNITYIEKPVDANITHTLTHHQVAKEIDRIIKQNNIEFIPIRHPVSTQKNPNPQLFTTACLDAIIKKYDLKNNKDYVVLIKNGNQDVYKYSKNIITWTVSQITADSNFVIKAKK